MTKTVFYLFVVSLPACYFTAMPSVLLCLLFLALYGEQVFIRVMNYEHAKNLEVHFDKMEKTLAEHQTAINAVNFKLGMGPMPKT
jgi:hypothetical protein